MTWQGKNLDILSDDELRDAILSVGDMDNFRFDKLAKPRKRHAKIFNSNPPIENPVFTQLINDLNGELKKRKLVI